MKHKEQQQSLAGLGGGREAGPSAAQPAPMGSSRGGRRPSPRRLSTIWQSIKMRCLNPRNTNFPHYGGRGISVCEAWRNSFQAFRQWAIDCGYDDSLQIDRIDNHGDYKPDNCRWVTAKENARNTSRNIRITVHGELLCLTDAAVKYGVPFRTLKYRIFKNGMTPELAVTVKPYQSKTLACLARHGDKFK